VQKKKSLQMLPLFSQKKYMSHRIYREGGDKILPHQESLFMPPWGPLSGHASPLGYFDRVVFKLQAFSW
jgi:hypothetical protein